jgi:hypothetical protein
VAHGGWPHATVVAHGGCKTASCRHGDTATGVYNQCEPQRLPNRRGPRQLDLKPPWAMTNGCQNCKIVKLCYNFAKWLYINKSSRSSHKRHTSLAQPSTASYVCDWRRLSRAHVGPYAFIACAWVRQKEVHAHVPSFSSCAGRSSGMSGWLADLTG